MRGPVHDMNVHMMLHQNGRLDSSTLQRMSLRIAVALLLIGVLVLLSATPSEAAPPEQRWAAVAASPWAALATDGHVALIRHAEAPGVGDPAEFTPGDCTTQRNLSENGQAQAGRLGAAFREHGVAVNLVLSSSWCRCIDTATLAFGAAEVWSPLDSFFRNAGTEATQTAAVRARIAAWTGPGVLVLVTHQMNITALTDIFPASGEIIVLSPAADRASGFSIAGRIVAP